MIMFDVAELKSRVNLLAVVEADIGPPRKQNGRWFSWPCPFHEDGDRDGGSLRVTPDTGTWFCFGCHATGDVIAWIRKRENLGFVEACHELGATNNHARRTARPREPLATFVPSPDSTWQQSVQQVADAAQAFLWSGGANSSLDYLHKRGLRDETLKTWGIGCNPVQARLPELPVVDGKTITVPRGITIPVQMNKALWALKVRQPDGYIPKYPQVTGGHAALFGTWTLSTRSIVLLAEGEFDAMLAWQEAGDLIGVASTTGGAKTWLGSWAVHLLAARTILVAYDNDQTGDEAATHVVASIGSRARRVRVSVGKDITEFWQGGGNVRDWVVSLLPGIPPRPTTGCSVCSNINWYWDSTWKCAVCAT